MIIGSDDFYFFVGFFKQWKGATKTNTLVQNVFGDEKLYG